MSNLQVGESFMPVQVLGPGIHLYQPANGDVLHDPNVIPQELPSEQVLLGQPFGECGGVKMANKVFELLSASGIIVYANHAPTHGADATKKFKDLGSQFGTPVAEIAPGEIFVISAHGAPPSVKREAEENGLRTFDVTCPLVERTHNPVRRAAEVEGGHVIYISFGKRDHPELVGTQGLAQEMKVPFSVVADQNEVDDLLLNLALQENLPRLVIVGQTTNNSEDANKLAEHIQSSAGLRGIGVERDGSHDVCHTVHDRQAATREIILAHGVGTLIVAGSINSKNTLSLAKVAAQAAASMRHPLDILLTNSWVQLPSQLSGKIGLVSGASTKAANVKGIIERLAPEKGVELVGKDSDKGIIFRPIDKNTQELLDRVTS